MQPSMSSEEFPRSMPPFEIPIVDGENRLIGKLSAFNDLTAANPALVEMLTMWRNKHRQFFLTQFVEVDYVVDELQQFEHAAPRREAKAVK